MALPVDPLLGTDTGGGQRASVTPTNTNPAGKQASEISHPLPGCYVSPYCNNTLHHKHRESEANKMIHSPQPDHSVFPLSHGPV